MGLFFGHNQITDLADARFIITINTALGTGSSFTLPLPSGYTYNFTIDWGDTNTSTITAYNDADITHTYSSGGVYQLKMDGKIGGWSFNNGGDRLKLTQINNWGAVLFDTIENGFYGCTNLSVLPLTGSISGTSSLIYITNLFRGCTNLTNTTNEIYWNLTSLIDAKNVYYQCTNLTTVGQDLFKNNTLITNMTLCFYFCQYLTTIPTDFLRYNTALTNIQQMFFNCYRLTTIPSDFLRYNIELTSVANMFNGCYLNLRNIPEDLFYYNTKVTTYLQTFVDCRNLVLPSRLFNLSNLSIVTTFASFMNVSSTTYSPTGTIQDIWNYTTATSTDAFDQCTAITNYADIPTAWK